MRYNFAIEGMVATLHRLAISSPSAHADLFVEFHPHCDLLTIRLFSGGWHDGQEPTRAWVIVLTAPTAEAQVSEALGWITCQLSASEKQASAQ